jgi:serine/threonine-protein kinase
MPDVIGSTLDGKYQIRKLLGEGAMGSVYEAEHTATGRRVAVKVISSADLTRDPKVVSRFQREARAAGAIETQHITQVLDAGVDRDSGLPFLAMEYLAGEDLMALVRRVGPLSPDLVLRIAAQACLGLMKAHEANVVHRDIKPHNLFLARREAGEVIVKLLDFGIAKVKMDRAHETEGAELTRTGNLLGSPLYMSPEQARGQKDIDTRTDIWSLGAVMYQALTARTPYHHINALGELIISICSVPPPPVQDFASWVPPEVAAIVHTCLQQDPARRFQSAEDMFQAIRQLLPYGWGIHHDMLVSLQDSMRQQAAPRLPMSMPPPPGPQPSYPSIQPQPNYPSVQPPPNYGSMQPPPYGTAVPAGTDPGAGTTGAVTQTQPQVARPGGSGKAVIAIGAVAVALAGAGGVYFFTRTPAPPPEPPPQAQVQPTATAEVTPPATTTAVATATPAAEARVQFVQVRIEPKDASVELGGKRIELKKTDVELEGKPVTYEGGWLRFYARLGSVHVVRVFKGKNETIENVSVTEGGALPPEVVLLPPGAKPAASPGSTSAPTQPPVQTPQAPPGIKENTDEFGN